MSLKPIAFMAIIFTMLPGAALAPATDHAQTGKQRIAESFGKLPLSFEANRGQAQLKVKFLSRGKGYNLLLTDSEAILMMNAGANQKPDPQKPESLQNSQPATAIVRLKPIGVTRPRIEGMDKLPGTSNYFSGADPAKWHTNIPTYARVHYSGIYPGVDLDYYGTQGQLEFDFTIAPGANPGKVRFAIEGASRLEIDRDGHLVLHAGASAIRLKKPFVYQYAGGQKQAIDGRYKLVTGNVVAFDVGQYDRRKPLVIDPVLVYSTYLGGEGDAFSAIAVDSLGNAYIAGSTISTNFPTVNPLQPNNAGGRDILLIKLNASGSALIYATYLGGSSMDIAYSMALDSSGNMYVTGNTQSTDFPTTAGAYRRTAIGFYDAIVAKLSASGSALLYSTYLGGSNFEDAEGIAVDSAGNAYVTGTTTSTNFPTVNAYQSTFRGYFDTFVTKVNPTGTGLVYSTYLGGTNYDEGKAIAVDANGNAYVAGDTESTNFPLVGPFQSVHGGSHDMFVTKFNVAGSALVYSTYLGGSNSDTPYDIALDLSGSVYLTGSTNSTNFPIVNALQPIKAGEDWTSDVLISKLSASGASLVYSTYLGGADNDNAISIAVDPASGNAFLTGKTDSSNFPTANPIQSVLGTGACAEYTCSDAIVVEINAGGSALVFSTYLGGSSNEWGGGLAVNSAGDIYIVGETQSSDFPLASPMQPTLQGISNQFVTKIGTPVLNPVPVLTSLNPSSTVSGSPDFDLTVDGSNFVVPSVVRWDGSNRSTTYVNSGRVTARILAADVASPGSKQITVFNPAPGGGLSNALTFTINTPNPIPTLAAISPSSTAAGGPEFDLTVTGTNFISTSVIRWNGLNRKTVYSSATQLVATIPASDIASPEHAQITVFNPAPGGGLSNALTFTINTDNPVPSLAEISPSSKAAGGPGFDLTIKGSNFITASVVRWNGSDRVTSYSSASQLTATIPASDIASPGQAQITVFNPTPGGGLSNAMTFTIANPNPVPTLTTISPSGVIAGGPGFTLTVTGSNFVSDSVIRWQGSNRTTTYSSSTQLTAPISAADIESPGVMQVAVFNPAPGGGLSNALNFTISLAGLNPVIESISPSSAIATDPAFILSIIGAGFQNNTSGNGSVVRWNGADRPTLFVDNKQLKASISTADIGVDGTANVTVCNLGGGGLSNSKPFTIQPVCPLPAPEPQTPIGATPQQRPQFTWSAVPHADGYVIAYFPLSRPAAIVVVSSSVNSYTPSEDLANGDYGWVVVGVSSMCSNIGAISAASFFTIPGTCPVKPMLAIPANNGTVTNPIQFAWFPAAGASAYYLTVISATTGATVIQELVYGTSYTTQTLFAGDYIWFVNGYNITCGVGPTSQIRSFRVPGNCPKSAPVLISPINVGVNNPVTFRWNNVSLASSYWLIVVNGASGQVTLQQQTSATQYTGTVADPGVNAWVVLPTTAGCDPGPASEVASFFLINSNCPPSAPTPISPNGTTVSSPVTFTWSSVANTTTYVLVVVNSNGEVVLTQPTANTQYTASLSSGNYAWVIVGTANGCGNYISDPVTFEVE